MGGALGRLHRMVGHLNHAEDLHVQHPSVRLKGASEDNQLDRRIWQQESATYGSLGYQHGHVTVGELTMHYRGLLVRRFKTLSKSGCSHHYYSHWATRSQRSTFNLHVT